MKRFGSFPRGIAVVLGIGLAVAMFSKVSSIRATDGSAKDASSASPGKLVVHEWGTFTSFSGSNGVQLDFRPLVDVDLPSFVFDHDAFTGESLFSKARVRARIRMETPVTYFYTDRERTVQASVEFPQGLLTEFYPPVASMGPNPQLQQPETPRLANGKLDWGSIHLIPTSAMAPSLQDARTNKWLQELICQRILPHDGEAPNHYYHARETDSALVHVHVPKSEEFPFRMESDHVEKFLFYRGVGRFDQPLKVTVDEDGSVRVTNSCKQAIRSLIRVTISDQGLMVSVLDQVGAGQTVDFAVAERPVNAEELQGIMVNALVGERLYPREAVAMAKTWADSWFAEEGTRIFYMVPQETTDQLLPLKITPTPDETVRVLVGRVEVMTPSAERDLLEVVRLRAKHRAVIARQQAEENIKKPIQLQIPNPIKKLGRLAEPALVRIRQLAKDQSVSDEAALLMKECQKPSEETSDAVSSTQ